jgi:hypothetical protein
LQEKIVAEEEQLEKKVVAGDVGVDVEQKISFECEFRACSDSCERTKRVREPAELLPVLGESLQLERPEKELFILFGLFEVPEPSLEGVGPSKFLQWCMSRSTRSFF